ncbi:MAG: hypothetical protein C3F12_03405 [Candidatus Methylomirabilota bacterium]|nr:hypothetical protein [Candidatus Methylomirabilis sp.]NJD68252.1 hypothetical protein [candidate division NC10 bacterium]PWB47744.1 MAG: hypothetical protein C3F12_03405 [candidate division NC10 bacterium]
MKLCKPFITLTVTIALIALGKAGPSPAADRDTAATPTEAAQGETAMVRTVVGTVTAVVPESNTLVVAVPTGKTDTLVVGASVTDQTVIKEGRTTKRLADLKVGDRVWMQFERVESGDIARTIVIK